MMMPGPYSIQPELKRVFNHVSVEDDEGVRPDQLFRELFCKPTIAQHVVYPTILACPSDFGATHASRSATVRWNEYETRLVKTLEDFGHRLACSAHLALMTIRDYSNHVEPVLDRLRQLYKARNPIPSERAMLVLERALKIGKPSLIASAKRLVDGTPFDSDKVAEELTAYLSSPGYPFGESELLCFKQGNLPEDEFLRWYLANPDNDLIPHEEGTDSGA